MAVEGIPQREVVVTFTAHFASYNKGEAACFTESEARRLGELGVAEPVAPDIPARADDEAPGRPSDDDAPPAHHRHRHQR